MDSIDVICIGNATIDVFVMLHKLQNFTYDKFSNQISFPLGEKVPLDEYKLSLGGNACNVSVGLSRLGLKTALCAEIGTDEFSQKIINNLDKEGVDQNLVKKDKREEPYFNIILGYEGDRTILEERNPSQADLEIGEKNPRFFYLTSFNGDWKKLYSDTFDANPNSLFALNPGSRQLENDLGHIVSILPKIEILFLNLGEAQKVAGQSSPDVKIILNKLKDLGTRIVVVTDGMNGSYAIDKNGQVFHVGVVAKDKPVERTGAGDSYATGFIYGFLNGRSLEDSMRYGAINADCVIKKVGAQAGLLTKSELEEKAKENNELVSVKI